MSNFNKFLGRLTALVAVLGTMWLTACKVDVDDTLGANLVPENQQMKAGYLALDNLSPRKFVETRLYQTDSILSANISNGYFGSMKDERLGRRTASFLTQYTNFYKVDSGYFGHKPFLDSAQLTLSITSYGGDTTVVQQFAVYEVVDNSYINEDTTYYLRFDPEAFSLTEEENGLRSVISNEPLFTFSLGGEMGPGTTAVTLTPTEAGHHYVRRLFLEEGEWAKNENKYSIYSTKKDSLKLWLETFKGLYIKPVGEPEGEGTIYVTSLEASTLSVYGRNRQKQDESLIQDTIGMVFYFRDTYYNLNPNISINTIKHDYSQGEMAAEVAELKAQIAQEQVEREAGNEVTLRPERAELIVEGMGGLYSEITFTPEFFEQFQKLLDDEKAASTRDFSTIAFSQAMIYFYMPSSIYDYLSIGPAMEGFDSLIDEMDKSQERLGLYTDYKSLENIVDYNYLYEQSYSAELPYGGYINRSHGRYAMNFTSHMQLMWNSYRNEREACIREERPFEWKHVQNRVLYLAPEANSAYTFDISRVQGVDNDQTVTPLKAPIKFEFTYNMVL